MTMVAAADGDTSALTLCKTMRPLPSPPAEAPVEPSQRQERPVLPWLDKTAIGRRGPGGAASVGRRERPDCLLYGPYWQLPAGDYRLYFACRAGRPLLAAEPVLGVEVIAIDRFQYTWRDFTAAELAAGCAALDFAVPAEHSIDTGGHIRFEFRFFHLGNAGLEIAAASLQRLSTAAGVEPRRWRLLGRLKLAARFGRGLFEVHPYLQLPAGCYRLTVAGQGGGTAEVVAQSRWRRQPAGWRRMLPRVPAGGISLGKTGLSDGSSQIEFAVPAELSLDRGEGARLQVRITGGRRAKLRLRAVDLQLLAERGELPPPAPCRRSLGRTRLIVIGNCQAQSVHASFCRIPALADRFDARYHFVDLSPDLLETGKRELDGAEFLLVQDIQDWRRYPLLGEVPPRARIVEFPLLRFASLWPFDQYNGLRDAGAMAQEWPNLLFIHLDGLLGRLRRDIPDPEARFAAYRDLAGVGGLVDFHRLHDFERRRLEMMDRKFGGEIGGFILDRFRRRRLFHTTIHPAVQVMAQLVRRLAELLDITGPVTEPHRIDPLGYLEVPVHPAVAAALGVRWAVPRTRYRYLGERLSWEEYVRRYIAHYG